MSGTVTPTSSPFVTNDQFRFDFPAFADPEIYQNATLTMYLTVAGNLLPMNLWGDLWTLGQELWAAHFILIDRLDEQTVSRGGNTTAGPVTSKSVGAVSVSYAETALERDGGHWNMTGFGRKFIRFARMVGAGGDQISGNIPTPGNWFPGSAMASGLGYAGPDTGNRF